MPHIRLELSSPVQEGVLKDLYDQLPGTFGITLIGPYLTLRWTGKDGKLKMASMTITDVVHGNYVQGIWSCEARAQHGLCEYDHDADPAHDSCIHCGQPHERK